ncbi:MAG: cytochrome c4 [Proteobacteria bacterium]|nr:cytochrome c4 [Pseudomonadota bacterium]MDE3207816.1 cytochrome c4 [Pseudomonadota bacterium]
MRRLFLLLASLSVLVSALPAQAQTQSDHTANFANAICAACHGANGISISPIFPKLAGQNASYLETQLKAFRDHSRADPDAQAYMWGMASRLNDTMIQNLAHYYASLPPSSGTPGPANEVKAGEAIFQNGIKAENVPACEACHGAAAQGIGSFPRLAGQQKAYIVRQLMAFKAGSRSNPIMMNIAAKLNAKQMQDLAAYLQSL